MADRATVLQRVEQIADRVAADKGLEVVEVQLLGGGAHRTLRIFLDVDPDSVATKSSLNASKQKTESVSPEEASGGLPAGVTHGDCEYVSHQVGTILDVEDIIPGGRYTLEVSSPGVERKLSRPRDFARFVGEKIKVTLQEPIEGQKTWTGLLSAFHEGVVTLEPKPGKSFSFPLEQVAKANLKFEWQKTR